MNVKDIISASYTVLTKLSKNRLLRAILNLREKYIKLEEKYNELKEENERINAILKKEKIKSINKDANKPSSKKPEWDKKGVGNDGKGRKKGKGRGKKPRKGAGNRPKDVKPDRTEKATVDHCSLCSKDLTGQEPLESSNERIIEDIPDIVERPEVIKVEQEKKYCNDCKEVITAKSELALPKADIGAEQHNFDLLSVGGCVFTIYEDQGLFEDLFWKRHINIRAFETCDLGFQDNERCIR